MTERGNKASAVSEREAALTSTFVLLADSLVSDYDVIDVLDHLVNTCVSILDVAEAGMLLDDLSGGLSVAAASSENIRLLEVFQSQTQQGPCRDCVATGRPVASEDLLNELRWPEFVPYAVAAGFTSVHAFPLRLRDQTVGALGLFCSGGDIASEADARLAQAFADIAAIGLLHQRSVHRSDVLAEQLRTALDSRVVIEQAKGVIAERENLSTDQAYQKLRRYSRDHNLKLTQVASAVVDGSVTLPT